MSKKHSIKGQAATAAALFIGSISKHFANEPTIRLLGTAFTPAELAAKLHTAIDLRADAVATKNAADAARIREDTALPALIELMKAFEAYVKSGFGNAPDVLADFALMTKKPAKPSAEVQVAAAAKREATRKARHTMGARQRRAIKGVAPDTVVIPIKAEPASE